MTTFRSTRGGPSVGVGEALARGLAPDGGLYVPERIGRFESPGPDAHGAFRDTARWAGARLLGADAAPWLDAVVDGALDFDVPLVPLGPDRWLLELFHGPTLAFKDVGARFMARALAATGPADAERTVLVATSGDTGSAVAAAFHGVAGTRVVALFPRNGVADRQRRQMTTLGGNVTAVAVDGTFDDCQRMTKEAFADAGLREAHRLTSANSINVGRWIPQSFYYVHAAARSGWTEAPAPFWVVPSGNLGNLCAGLLAHRAGMPARGFLAATNRNRPFPDFLATGRYEPRPSVATPSNAMDVGAPSNLERIQWLYSGDAAALRSDVSAVSVDDDSTVAAMRAAYDAHGAVLDPHTAVGLAAVERIDPGAGPVVILATAHPAKFPDAVERATGVQVDAPPALAAALAKPEHVVSIAPTLLELRSLLEGLSPS
ncbi:MAG: threonine synthase [Longimicrobiales bacterium]